MRRLSRLAAMALALLAAALPAVGATYRFSLQPDDGSPPIGGGAVVVDDAAPPADGWYEWDPRGSPSAPMSWIAIERSPLYANTWRGEESLYRFARYAALFQSGVPVALAIRAQTTTPDPDLTVRASLVVDGTGFRFDQRATSHRPGRLQAPPDRSVRGQVLFSGASTR